MGRQTVNKAAGTRTERTTARSRLDATERAWSSPFARAMKLQRRVGNRAMSELIRSGANARNAVESAPAIRAVLSGSGYPLHPATRAVMEARFGYDFSRVRVHTDTRATEIARALGARAFTVGSHVVFGSGQYAPRSSAGKRLLAHELAHAVQQRDARVDVSLLTISAPHDAHESAAERIARDVSRDLAERPSSRERATRVQLAPAPAHIAREVDPLGVLVSNTPQQRLNRVKDLLSQMTGGGGMLNGIVADETVIELKSADGSSSRLFRVRNPLKEVPNLGVHGESGLVRDGNSWEMDEIAQGSASDTKAGRIVLDEKQTIGEMALTLYRTRRQMGWNVADPATLQASVGQADPAKARAEYVKEMVENVVWRNVEQIQLKKSLQEAGAIVGTKLLFEDEYNAAYNKALIEEMGKGVPGRHTVDTANDAGSRAIQAMIESGKVATHTGQKYAEHFASLFDEKQAQWIQQQAELAKNTPAPQPPPQAPVATAGKPAEKPAPIIRSEDDLYKAFLEAPQWQRDQVLAPFQNLRPVAEPPAAEPAPAQDIGCHTDPYKRRPASSVCAPGHHKQQDQAALVTKKFLEQPGISEQLAQQEREHRAQLDRLNEAHFHWQATKQYIHRDEFSPYEIEKDNIIPASTRWDLYNSDPKNLETADFHEHFFRSPDEYRLEWERRKAEYVRAFEACSKEGGLKAPKLSRKRPESLDCRERVQAEYFPGRAALQDASRWAMKLDVEAGMPAVTDQGFTAAAVFHVTHEWLGWSTQESADAAGIASTIAGFAEAKIQKTAIQRQSTGGSYPPPSGKSPAANIAPKPNIEPMPAPDPWAVTAPAKQTQTGTVPLPQDQPHPVSTPSVQTFSGPSPNVVQGGGQSTSPPTGKLSVVGEGNQLGPAFQPKSQRSSDPVKDQAAQQVAQKPLAATGTGDVAAIVVQGGGTQPTAPGTQPTVMTGRTPPPGAGANVQAGRVATQTGPGGAGKPPTLSVISGSGAGAQNVPSRTQGVTAGSVTKDQFQTKLNELQTTKQELERKLTRQQSQVAGKTKKLNDLNSQNISTHGPEITQAKKRLADETKKLQEIQGQLRDVHNEINLTLWELAKGQKPWRDVRLDTTTHVGLYGELESTTRLQERGWEPIGNTFRPDAIRLPADLAEALRKYEGRQGIDGIYKRTRNGVTEYLIVESKGTLDAYAPTPGGKGLLDTTASGVQLSRKWTVDNIPRTGLSEAEQKDLVLAIQQGRATFVYAQTVAQKGTRFFKAESSETEVKIGEAFDP